MRTYKCKECLPQAPCILGCSDEAIPGFCIEDGQYDDCEWEEQE